VTDPTLEEARDSLVRAMKAGCDYIAITSRRQQWLWKAAEMCVEQGWLSPGLLVEDYEEQCSELRYRPTAVGRALGAGVAMTQVAIPLRLSHCDLALSRAGEVLRGSSRLVREFAVLANVYRGRHG